MCPDDRAPFGVLILSVVKHDYIARALAQHPRFRLTAVADSPDQPDWVHQRNQEFADAFGLPYERNIQRAIEQHNVDVAVVSSEAERHCELTVQAADAGVHVIQDKPMSNRISECDRVVDAVQRNGVKFMMWSRNFLPAVVHARNLVRAGEIGRPVAIHADFYFAKDAGPPLGTRGPDDPPLDWLEVLIAAHATGADGGVGQEPMGELSNEGSYPLAYIHSLIEQPARRVFARTTSHFHQLHADNQVEDLASVSIEFDGGEIASLSIGRIGAASHPDLGEIKLHIVGTDGSLVISEARPEIAIYYRGQPADEFRHHRVEASDNDFLLCESFATAIDTDGPTVLDAVTSRNITATIAAAIRSGKSGHIETVPSRD